MLDKATVFLPSQPIPFLSAARPNFFLQAVVSHVLRWMGDTLDLFSLLAPLLYPMHEEILGEDPALGEVFVILFKSVESLGERPRQTLDIFLFIRAKVLEIEIERPPVVVSRVDLVL